MEISDFLKKQENNLKEIKKSLAKAMDYKQTAKDIVSDLKDKDDKAEVSDSREPAVGTAVMTKGANPKPKNQAKGVHQPYMSSGESMAGELAREGKNKPGKMGDKNKEASKDFHKQKLGQLKQIKPNLPKSEESITLKPHPKPVADVDPKVRDHLDDSSHTQIKKGIDSLKEFLYKRENSNEYEELAKATKENWKTSHPNGGHKSHTTTSGFTVHSIGRGNHKLFASHGDQTHSLGSHSTLEAAQKHSEKFKAHADHPDHAHKSFSEKVSSFKAQS